MNRRRFMQVAGVAGLAVMAPFASRFSREARAGAARYKGPYWIMVNAGGGWDPTMLMDPKGGTNPMDPMQVDLSYTPSQIGQAGNIAYAPTTWGQNNVTLMTAAQFFGANHQRLMVLNGVDTSTNNHDAGSRTTWSGQLSDGFPAFAALVAATATAAQPLPLAFLSNGGYDTTAGVISLSRVGDSSALQKLAFVNQQDPTNPKTDLYHTPTTAARIAAAQQARLQAAQRKQSLPAVSSAMGSLFLARQSDDGLAALGDELRTVKGVKFPDDFPSLAGIGGIDDLEPLLQQVQVATLAFKAGVAVSANLNMSGFDSHNNSDPQQSRQYMLLCFALDYLFKQIDALGMTNDVFVVVGSDFGRTPFYNTNNNGKDHWNITSMMLAGPKIPGNTVVGTTDAGLVSISVDPHTLKPSTSGERIGTTNVHLALRKLAGVSGTALDKQFGLPGDFMPLFG